MAFGVWRLLTAVRGSIKAVISDVGMSLPVIECVAFDGWIGLPTRLCCLFFFFF